MYEHVLDWVESLELQTLKCVVDSFFEYFLNILMLSKISLWAVAVKVLWQKNGQVAGVFLCRGIFMRMTNKKKYFLLLLSCYSPLQYFSIIFYVFIQWSRFR